VPFSRRGGQSNPFRNGENQQSGGGIRMYRHIKKLMYAVNVGSPDARFGNMLLEQFGGANGELAAALAARGIRAENGKSLSLQN
jgi:hypothetical protein